MDHNIALATSSVKQNIGRDERMCLCRWPHRWSCGDVEAKHVALPDAACPGLHWKQLDVAIGGLLGPYSPGGRHGNNQQNNDAKCTLFAGRFDGHCNAAVLYRAHRLMEEAHGFHS